MRTVLRRDYVVSSSLRWTETLGGCAIVVTLMQVISGVLLGMRYSGTSGWEWLEVLMVGTGCGREWRMVHVLGSLMLMVVVYVHMLKGLSRHRVGVGLV